MRDMKRIVERSPFPACISAKGTCLCLLSFFEALSHVIYLEIVEDKWLLVLLYGHALRMCEYSVWILWTAEDPGQALWCFSDGNVCAKEL